MSEKRMSPTMCPKTITKSTEPETLKQIAERLRSVLKDNNTKMNKTTASIHELASRILQKVNGKENMRNTHRANHLITVEIRCTFLKIGDIDTVMQNFDAEVLIQAKWEEPFFSGLEKDKPNFDPHLYWEPKLMILNLNGDFHINEKNYTIRFHSEGYVNPVVVLLWRIKGNFREHLELEHFPFDVQELGIQVSSEKTIEEIEIKEDKHAMSNVNINMFLDSQEWSIYQHVDSVSTMTTREYASFSVHSVLYVLIKVKRKVGFFFYNVVIVVCLILALSFCGFSIDANNPDRMGLTITLFLTTVTFKLVLKSHLPTISYLTYLDIYLFGTLFFLAMLSSESSVMCWLSKWLPLSEVILWDNWTIASLCAVLIAFHMILGYYIFQTALQKRRLLAKKDAIYRTRREYLENHGILLTFGNPSLHVQEE